MPTTSNQNNNWKFNWFTSWDEVWQSDFVKQWQAWIDKSPSVHVFFHPALVKAWVDTYLLLRDIKPYFLIAELEESIVFLPLVLWRRNWKNAFQRLLIPVGYSDYDYHDPLMVNANGTSVIDSFWPQFAYELSNHSPVKYDTLHLDGIREKYVPNENSLKFDNKWTQIDICPWIDLKSFKKPEDFLPSLKTSLRQDLRRQQRRMSEIGDAQFTVFNKDTISEALMELPTFLAVHAKRWPMSYKAPSFHEKLIRFGLPANVVHFSVLRLNNVPTAWHLSFIFKNCLYSYMPTHDTALENLSPSKVLLLKCIEDAISRGLTVYDFMRGDESYKTGWTDKSSKLWSFQFIRQHFLSSLRNATVLQIKSRIEKLL